MTITPKSMRPGSLLEHANGEASKAGADEAVYIDDVVSAHDSAKEDDLFPQP